MTSTKHTAIALHHPGRIQNKFSTFEVLISNPEGKNTKHPPLALVLVAHVMGLNRVGKPCKNKGVQFLHDEQ